MLQVEHCLASAWAKCFARSSRGAFAPRVFSPRAMPAFAPSTCPKTAAPSNSSKQVYDAKESLSNSGLGLLISASLFWFRRRESWFQDPVRGSLHRPLVSVPLFSASVHHALAPGRCFTRSKQRVVLYVLEACVWVRASPHLNLPG